jgi:hypothetical protein
MKFDGFPREKTILSFKLANGAGWLTTHRLIIQKETLNPRFNIMERQDPEMYLLRDFEKAEIKGETLTAISRVGKKRLCAFSCIRLNYFKRSKITLRKRQNMKMLTDLQVC